MKAVSDFVAAVRAAQKSLSRCSEPEVLILRRLGRAVGGVFRPNYACLLLFGRDPLRLIPGCKIHFQRFEGEVEGTGDKYNVSKEAILEGRVPI